MPFLLPLVPAIASGAAAAGGGALIKGALDGGQGGGSGTNIQMPAGTTSAQLAAKAQEVYAQQQQAAQQQQTQQNQLSNAYDQSQKTMGQQQQLYQQLQGQNGIQNQSQVYGQQQALASQLGQMAQGGGPNPALDQLNNSTGQNIASQASLMAGQRGAGANAGLIARQAAQQGGALQQQAAGQGAVLRSNQQLGAISALQNQQGMLGNLANSQVGQQQNALNALNSSAQGQQSLLTNTDLAKQQMANQQQIAGMNNQNAQKLQSNQQNYQTAGGIAKGIGSAITSAFAEGGQVGYPAIMKENYKGRSSLGKHLFAQGGTVQNMKSGGHVPGKAKVSGARDSYANDTVDAVLSPGEIVLPRSVTQSSDPVAASAKFVAALKAKKGKK